MITKFRNIEIQTCLSMFNAFICSLLVIMLFNLLALALKTSKQCLLPSIDEVKTGSV